MRQIKEWVLKSFTFLFASVGFVVLMTILWFVFANGSSLLSFDLLTGNYYAISYNTKYEETYIRDWNDVPSIEDAYYSDVWGIAVKDVVGKDNIPYVRIVYVDIHSPFNNMIDLATNQYVRIESGQTISRILMENSHGERLMALSREGAQVMVEKLNQAVVINDMISQTAGGGIRASIITTLYLIGLTLIISLPIGILAAIYLNEFAPKNKITQIIRSMIDMVSGIPSIIFGLVGAFIFIPFMNRIVASDGGSIASGALTLSIILLPIIIRTTEEGLKVIPQSYRLASFALGASQTQTTFKIVIKNALGGILAATLLSIGRIIGESAALIYAIGTVINDHVALNDRSTSLAVHIWILMSGENPNFGLSSAIAIVILIVVFILSIGLKFITNRLNKGVTK